MPSDVIEQHTELASGSNDLALQLYKKAVLSQGESRDTDVNFEIYNGVAWFSLR